MANKNKIEEKPAEEKPTQEKAGGTARSEKSFNPGSDLYAGISEKTFFESPYWGDSQLRPYNPDDLVRRRNDYKIYEQMLIDDQVDTCMQIKKDLCVGTGFDIQPQVSDGSHDEIVKDIEVALSEDVEVEFDDILEEAFCSSFEFGFALSEKVFKYRDDGSITLKNVKTRHPATWDIHTDKHGNIEKYVQHGPEGDISVDPDSLMHVVNRRKFGNPYGQSDLRTAYYAWFFKCQIVKWYGIFLEKAASPIPIATHSPNEVKEVVDTVFAALKKFQQRTAMTIPNTFKVDFLESKSSGEAYTKGIALFNMFIGRALLIPDLLGFQGAETGGGSYSLGKDQIAVFFKHIERRRARIEGRVNKEIIFPIVVHNHGFIDNYPKFKLRPISEDSLIEAAKAWLEAVKGKVWKASDEEVNYFRSIVKFPQGDVDREQPAVLGPDGKPLPPNADPSDGGGDSVDGVDSPSDESDGDDVAGDKGKPDAAEPKGKEKEEGAGKKNFAAKVYKKLPGEFDQKTDYTAIVSSMDRAKSSVTAEALPVVRRLYEDLYSQMRAKKIIEKGDLTKIEALSIKSPRELNLILRRMLRDGYKDGQNLGQRELLKGNFRAPLPDDKFLEFIENETYQYIGDWAYDVTKKARVKILEAIRDGKPLSAVMDMLDAEGIDSSMASLERWARTKFTDVMNRGRLASFQDSGVVSAYQYSAILDDVTSPICAGLHGKIFKSGTEPVPPMHWNCRSLLVPITKYESFEVDSEVAGKSINDFIEENKGDGFARR